MKVDPDGLDSASARLLQAMRSDLARSEATRRAAPSLREADRLYERVLRYRRIVAMLENRARMAVWRVSAASAGRERTRPPHARSG